MSSPFQASKMIVQGTCTNSTPLIIPGSRVLVWSKLERFSTIFTDLRNAGGGGGGGGGVHMDPRIKLPPGSGSDWRRAPFVRERQTWRVYSRQMPVREYCSPQRADTSSSSTRMQILRSRHVGTQWARTHGATLCAFKCGLISQGRSSEAGDEAR